MVFSYTCEVLHRILFVDMDIQNIFVYGGIMSLEARLIKLKIELDKSALRHPMTVQQILDRKKWERVRNILINRYKRYE